MINNYNISELVALLDSLLHWKLVQILRRLVYHLVCLKYLGVWRRVVGPRGTRKRIHCVVYMPVVTAGGDRPMLRFWTCWDNWKVYFRLYERLGVVVRSWPWRVILSLVALVKLTRANNGRPCLKIFDAGEAWGIYMVVTWTWAQVLSLFLHLLWKFNSFARFTHVFWVVLILSRTWAEILIDFTFFQIRCSKNSCWFPMLQNSWIA